MDMRGQHERRFAVTIEHVEGFRFSSQASEDGRLHGEPFASDEPDPVGEASAPATPALLGAALGHCLTASLLEVLRHSHVEVVGCTTEAVALVARNEEGLPRIDHVDVAIRPRLAERSPKTRRAEQLFERYCTVTSSVKRGIDVRVRVEWDVPAEAPEPALTESA